MRRQDYLNRIDKAFNTHKVAALLGPRQCGKTTLANDYIASHLFPFERKNYFR